MSERAALWRAAAAAAVEGRPAALATVARQRGSLPMASDAKMLVTPDGGRVGTVGGGCVEADVTDQALEALAAGQPRLVRHTLNADVAGDLGLSCGGTVELFLEPLITGADAAALYGAVADAIANRTAGTVLTALDWSHGPHKALYLADRLRAVGNWPVSPVPPAACAAPAASAAVLDHDSGLFIEPIPRVPRLILFGAGHVGAEIARAAAATDFHVVVVDDRADFANATRFPWAAQVIVRDLRAALDDLVLDEDDHVIACTRGHAMDALIIERTAASAARYVGMLGSRRKQAVIWKALETAGVPRSALERVKVPIGEGIGADTPGEIGIAVMAELIRLRRTGQAGGTGKAGE
jgi:xanthine dehydrogenase accessory factor